MASTTLFAPSVRVVQPAFIYPNSNGDTTVRVYFTLNYNTIDQVQKLRYSLIDPNKSSIDGGNSMFSSNTTKEVEKDNINSNSGEYYFDVNFSNGFKPLTINQFYQIQIELYDGGDWSLPSTISLIRPIAPIRESDDSLQLSGQKLCGQIQYEDDSTIETIARYRYSIECDGHRVFPSIDFWNTNFLGTKFETIIPHNLEEDKTYTIKVWYETKHGYKNATPISKEFYIPLPGVDTDGLISFAVSTPQSPNPKIDYNIGGLSFKFSITDKENLQGTEIHIERTDEFVNNTIWTRLATIDLSGINLNNPIEWTDSFVQSRTEYKYRLVSTSKSKYQLFKIKDQKNTVLDHFSADFEDIYLSDNDALLAIRYNPKISNYKWVTQDNITNTLGGKYPVIRRNGDQFYRQFSLSGTLYFDNNSASIGNCSCADINMSNFFVEEEKSFYLSSQKEIEYKEDPKKQTRIQKRVREIATEFLSNGSVKVFRSGEEDTMIVFLSGVSFTPNPVSGRHIYDFSATATEVCEATEDNLKKYGLDMYTKYSYNMIEAQEVRPSNENTSMLVVCQQYPTASNKLYAQAIKVSAMT